MRGSITCGLPPSDISKNCPGGQGPKETVLEMTERMPVLQRQRMTPHDMLIQDLFDPIQDRLKALSADGEHGPPIGTRSYWDAEGSSADGAAGAALTVVSMAP